MKGLFSEKFDIEASKIEEYGAINISLVCDIPLFIDPLLIFNSNNTEYKELHKSIIKYFHFLATKANNNLTQAEIKTWFTFKEVCNNWLGYSLEGNKGSALNMKFANILYKNIRFILENNNITKGIHAEKIMLLYDGSGKDNISDMIVNLIKSFLCSYTEKFAKEYLSNNNCKDIIVEKVEFNYETESFISKEYYLPYIINEKGKEEYILLTPKDILREEEPSINRRDFYTRNETVRNSIDNDVLRVQVDNYIQKAVLNYEQEIKKSNKKIKESDINKIKIGAFDDMVKENPIIYDYYIRLRENEVEETKIKCLTEVNEQLEKLIIRAERISVQFKELGYNPSKNITAREESKYRIEFFKHIIEDCDGYKILYYKDKRIAKEDDLNRMFRLVWADTDFKQSYDANNGRGEADVVVSKGVKNQCVVEFKLASNSKLSTVFKQADVYCKANDCLEKLIVIFYFTESEYIKTQNMINKFNFGNLIDKEIFLIDCRNDNKIAGSKVK
ncbi:MAG: hypothetical protein WC123_04775 [Bacilli bacterium]